MVSYTWDQLQEILELTQGNYYECYYSFITALLANKWTITFIYNFMILH